MRVENFNSFFRCLLNFIQKIVCKDYQIGIEEHVLLVVSYV